MTATLFSPSSSDYPGDVSLDLSDICGPHRHAAQFLHEACTVATDWIQVSHDEARRLACSGTHEIIVVVSLPCPETAQPKAGAHETALAVFRATGETRVSEAWSRSVALDRAVVFGALRVPALWYYAAVSGQPPETPNLTDVPDCS